MSTGLRDRERVPVPVVHFQGTASGHSVQLRTVSLGPQDVTGRAQHLLERGATSDRRRTENRQLLRELLRE